MNYEDDPRFHGYYFEESYVLALSVSDNEVIFRLDAVLTPSHQMYTSPLTTRSYCYHPATLYFRSIQNINEREINLTPTVDPDGSIDYGNIDYFIVESSDLYILGGEWGKLSIVALDVGITPDVHNGSELGDNLAES